MCVFSVAQGSRGEGDCGGISGEGHLAGASIRGPWMCGQGHKQSGSLKVGVKTLS